jgi:hypothetical protein
MSALTFDSLPGIVAEINKKLDLLIADRASQVKDEDYLMTIEELRDYLPDNPARQTVYMWVNDRKIPYEKFSKRLYFRKSSIDNWIANGRQL